MCSYLPFPTVPFPPHRPGGDAEPGLLQVPTVQLLVLEDLQPFPLPIPNNTMELGPGLSQGIINGMLAFKGFLQQSWLHFCIWLPWVCFCQRSQQCPSAKAVQAIQLFQIVFVSHFSCLSRRKINVGHIGWLCWRSSPGMEVWGWQSQCSWAAVPGA